VRQFWPEVGFRPVGVEWTRLKTDAGGGYWGSWAGAAIERCRARAVIGLASALLIVRRFAAHPRA